MRAGRAVPFYVYAPPAYRANAVCDRERIGSHKDIMPTLYQLSPLAGPAFNPAATCWRGIRTAAGASVSTRPI